MTWFSGVAWSVRADLLCSIKLDARRLSVNVRRLDSTSVLCSCNLTRNFQFPVIDREPERFTRWIKEAIHI